jgi:hypothetical protein
MIAAEDNPLEAIRQEHEGFLSQLEGLAVEAIATNDWTKFYAHVVDFQNENDLYGEALIAIGAEASGDELDTRTTGSLPNDQLNES